MIIAVSLLVVVHCVEHDASMTQQDAWPSNITSMGRLFQTTQEHPEQVKLEYLGRVPHWIEGSFYRNGPGKNKYRYNNV